MSNDLHMELRTHGSLQSTGEEETLHQRLCHIIVLKFPTLPLRPDAYRTYRIHWKYETLVVLHLLTTEE